MIVAEEEIDWICNECGFEIEGDADEYYNVYGELVYICPC